MSTINKHYVKLLETYIKKLEADREDAKKEIGYLEAKLSNPYSGQHYGQAASQVQMQQQMQQQQSSYMLQDDINKWLWDVDRILGITAQAPQRPKLITIEFSLDQDSV